MISPVTVLDVKDRLSALRFPTTEADGPLLGYSLEKAMQYIKNDCNISEIPEALTYALIDLAATEFLQAHKSISVTGEDSGGLAFEQAVKVIQEGDTSVTYMTAAEGGSTPESRLDTLISRLRSDVLDQLLPFRRLKW